MLQAKLVASKLEKYQVNQVYMSPFWRCIQTASLCAEELGIPADDWTVSCTVGEVRSRQLADKFGHLAPLQSTPVCGSISQIF